MSKWDQRSRLAQLGGPEDAENRLEVISWARKLAGLAVPRFSSTVKESDIDGVEAEVERLEGEIQNQAQDFERRAHSTRQALEDAAGAMTPSDRMRARQLQEQLSREAEVVRSLRTQVTPAGIAHLAQLTSVLDECNALVSSAIQQRRDDVTQWARAHDLEKLQDRILAMVPLVQQPVRDALRELSPDLETLIEGLRRGDSVAREGLLCLVGAAGLAEALGGQRPSNGSSGN
jgi:septation ring formation regulator EzrA